MKSLDERIAAFMSNGARTTDVAALIAELDGVIAETRRECARQDEISKSATATEDQAEAAADEAAKLSRKLVRLEAKQQQLRERHEQLLNSERAKRAQAEKDAALARRDALAEELRERWPALCEQFVDLLDRLQASDNELLPYRAESAEAIARGCPPNFYDGVSPMTRFEKLRLPSLTGRGLQEMAWPRHVNHFAESERAMRAQLLAREDQKKAEANRWKRYIVTAPDDKRVAIETRRGATFLEPGRSIASDMTGEFVESARQMGCNVVLLKPGETLGLPASAAVI